MTLDSVATRTALREQARHSGVAAVWALIGANLYLVWRRAMSKALLGILVALFAIYAGFTALIYSSIQTAAQSSCPAGGSNCQPSPQEAEALHRALTTYGGYLTFPTSLGAAGGFAGFIGALLVAVLAGTVVGSEYGFGTVRAALSRGLGRATLLAGQVLAFAVLALVAAAICLGAGALVGVTIGPAFGLSLGQVTADGAREIGVYALAVALNVLLYALVAQFFATLGRSAAAGIGAGVGLLFLEFLVNFIYAIIGPALTGDWGERIRRIPDWFPGNNVSALTSHAGAGPIALTQVTPTTLDLTHAALVTAVYVVLLIGGSYALLRARDITD